MTNFLHRLALGLLVIAPLGCDSSGSNTGQVSLRLTDGAGDFHAAVITITGIYLQGDANDSEGGRVWLSHETTTTNLVTLANDTATLVEQASVPTGSYSGLRFVISGGYVEVENADGSTSIYASSTDYAGLPAGATVTGDLQMPSFAQSGLKVTIPEGELVVTDGDEKILLVEFDVSQSFGHAAGGANKWVMHPVVHATDIVVSGSIAVTAQLAVDAQLPVKLGLATLGDVRVRLTDKDGGWETLALTDPNSDQVFTADFRYLDPRQGPFELDFVLDGATAVSSDPATPYSVTVPEGGTAQAAFTVTGSIAAP